MNFTLSSKFFFRLWHQEDLLSFIWENFLLDGFTGDKSWGLTGFSNHLNWTERFFFSADVNENQSWTDFLIHVGHRKFFLNIFCTICVISPFKTQTMHIKSFYTQQHCYVSLKNLIPWRDSNPGLLVPGADVMSTAPRRDKKVLQKTIYFQVKNCTNVT
jgi:hypothetical protein